MANSSIRGPLLLTLVVALGIAVAWGVAAVWTIAALAEFRSAQQRYEAVYVRVDGLPVIFRSEADSVCMTTLDGEPIAVDQQLLLHPQYVYPPGEGLYAELNWSRRLTAASDGGAPAIYWYLLHDGRINGSAYGVGFHAVTRRIVGYFGRNGFSNQRPPRQEWFEIAGSHGLAGATDVIANTEPTHSQTHELALVASGELWLIDLRKRTVTNVAEVAGSPPLSRAWRLVEDVPDTPGIRQISATSWVKQKLLLREREQIMLVDPESGESQSYSLPESLQSASFGVFELADGRLLIAVHEVGFQTDEALDQSLVWLDPQGKIVERKALHLATWQGAGAGQATWSSIVVAPFLVATLLFTLFMQYMLVEQGRADSFADALVQALPLVWPAIVIVVLLGLIAAVAAYRRQRHFALPHAAWWSAFVFLLGVPGWLAYRYHRIWPPLAACPACQQPVPRDRVACSQCGATFSPPARKGIEVYA